MTRCSLLIAAMTSIAITVARSGHELPVYPSYYPHEIEITTVASERAADLLRDGKMHAYVGGTPRFAGAIPETITAVESRGSFVSIRHRRWRRTRRPSVRSPGPQSARSAARPVS